MITCSWYFFSLLKGGVTWWSWKQTFWPPGRVYWSGSWPSRDFAWLGHWVHRAVYRWMPRSCMRRWRSSCLCCRWGCSWSSAAIGMRRACRWRRVWRCGKFWWVSACWLPAGSCWAKPWTGQSNRRSLYNIRNAITRSASPSDLVWTWRWWAHTWARALCATCWDRVVYRRWSCSWSLPSPISLSRWH